MKSSVIKQALSEAEKSISKFGIGAVIFKGSRIFGIGHNSIRGSFVPDRFKRYPNSFHAEIAAMHNVSDKNKINGASILVVRVTKSGNISKAFPCKYCMKTLKHVGIKNIYYSNRQGEIVRRRI